jgi:thioredoxin-like negative regulator of GroEL
MKDKIVTIFRTKQCKNGKALTEAVRLLPVDQESVQVVYVNEEPAIATFFRIIESPTVLMFEDGEETVRHEGAVPPEIILAFLNS